MKLSPVFLFLSLDYKTLVGASAQWPVSLPSPPPSLASLPANFHNLSFSSERNETASSGFFFFLSYTSSYPLAISVGGEKGGGKIS